MSVEKNVYVESNKANSQEWRLNIEVYSGDETAEEFAVKHRLIALNNNDDDESLSYVFIGTEDNVKEAFEDYVLRTSEKS